MPIENGFKPERLRAAMSARGMNQKQLAAAAGLTPTAVSHYLNGERDPRTAAVRLVAERVADLSDAQRVTLAVALVAPGADVG